jgi:acetyl-CoA acetyltransferase
VVVGGEKMTHLPTPKVSELIGRSLDPYERSYGTTMPAFAALVTRALMAKRGVTEREIAQVAVKNHAHGRAQPAGALPRRDHARHGAGKPHGRRSAAPLSLLSDLRRRRRRWC